MPRSDQPTTAEFCRFGYHFLTPNSGAKVRARVTRGMQAAQQAVRAGRIAREAPLHGAGPQRQRQDGAKLRRGADVGAQPAGTHEAAGRARLAVQQQSRGARGEDHHLRAREEGGRACVAPRPARVCVRGQMR